MIRLESLTGSLERRMEPMCYLLRMSREESVLSKVRQEWRELQRDEIENALEPRIW